MSTENRPVSFKGAEKAEALFGPLSQFNETMGQFYADHCDDASLMALQRMERAERTFLREVVSFERIALKGQHPEFQTDG